MNRFIRLIWATCALAALPVLCGCGSPPQLGDSKEALGAADALWTAITAKRADLVDASATQLSQLKEAGKIPPDAAASLDEIVEQARAGQWDSAREDLKTFVKAQRGSK